MPVTTPVPQFVSPYRSHHCGQLRASDVGQTVTLSGWIHRKRDHGGVLFIDLRDTYGLTQCVIDEGSPLLEAAAKWRVESVVTFVGQVTARPGETANSQLPTGAIEVRVLEATLQSGADVLPFPVADNDVNVGEEFRLRHRYLDLRREGMHSRVRLRNAVIQSMRQRMWGAGFQEFQTPILTASSPEGARDYLVPSRLHAGKFYALPQAPQQFKQLLMMSGFDRYFQVAPCFRDEDGRADRLAEFYQLDVEMSFVTQPQVFATMEPVVSAVFEEFADFTGVKHTITQAPWPHITYQEAMLKYGSDKPDLRNPLVICDVTEVFARPDVEFKAFKGIIEKGGVVRAIRAPNVADKARSFFDKLNDWARGEGAAGLGYVLFEGAEGKGPIAKFIPEAAQAALKTLVGAGDGDAVFFVCDMVDAAVKMAGKARQKICDDMGNREQGVFKFCWITEFPFYSSEDGKIDFEHNPFSMPQGGLDALNNQDPLTIKAQQYDCVCNGFEIASGGIRNHSPEVMVKAFEIAGYDKEELEKRFGGMLNAMRFGAPPHGGLAYGVDRIVMLLANEPNLREVYAFVMNGAYEDQMMNAPNEPTEETLKSLHVRVVKPVAKAAA